MIRVRFAPSPTGPLHIGGVRTALYNYFFARKNNGSLILRIEDTDQQRFVEGAEDYIVSSLKWCGIDFDESPEKGGEFGPYRQSERKNIYPEYIKQLIEKGHAYYAFDTPEELEIERQKNPNFQYDRNTRISLKNSITLSPTEVNSLINDGVNYVVRIKIPDNETIIVDDLIRGKVEFNSELLDDKVIFKSDGLPTYHLANIVDDHLMKISHVIRGEEWLPSAPLHVYLYQCFSWEPPKFAHLPLILKTQGNGKLSKRDGDKIGFPVFPCDWADPKTGDVFKGYKEWGYLPEAFVNMLSLLGWNSGTVQEIFSMEELINEFSLEKVHKSGSKFDPEKTKWFNHQYILNLKAETCLPIFRNKIEEMGHTTSDDYISLVFENIKDRMYLLTEFWEHASYFYIDPESFNKDIIQKHYTSESISWLKNIVEIIENTENWDISDIENNIKIYLSDNNIPMGKVFNLLRVALTGANQGIGIGNIIFILGKSVFSKRVNNLTEFLMKNYS